MSKAKESGIRKAEFGGTTACRTPESHFRFRICPAPSPQPPSPGRLAGVDYGTVRIGIAITDPGRQIASPLENYTRRTPDLDAQRFRRVGGRRGDRAVGRRPAGPSRRPREPEIAGGPAVRPVAGRGDRRAGRVFRRAVHQRRGRAIAAGRRPDAANVARSGMDMLAAQIMLSAYLESQGQGAGAARPSGRLTPPARIIWGKNLVLRT